MLIAFIPDAHTLFTVVQGTFSLIPAKIAACLAGACPNPVDKTLPIKTSSTKLGLKFIFFKALFMATAPNAVVGIVDKFPKKLPIGVRIAEAITTFLDKIIDKF